MFPESAGDGLETCFHKTILREFYGIMVRCFAGDIWSCLTVLSVWGYGSALIPRFKSWLTF